MSTFRSRRYRAQPEPDMSPTKELVYRYPVREREKPLLPGWVWEGLLYLVWGVLIGAALGCCYVLAKILLGG
jgi:hypothetical protein